MFFSDRIVSIKPDDKVLEIGPGGTPHDRADIFLDLDPTLFHNEQEAAYQRGSAPKLKTDKPIIYYDGTMFPFADKEYDYVICSHVLEHVENVALFLQELFRVGRMGYIEYPTVYYDYLYNIPVHYNFLTFDSAAGTLIGMKKSETHLQEFSKVQEFFLRSLGEGHVSLVNDMKNIMFEGFEWSAPFDFKEVHDLNKVTPYHVSVPTPAPPQTIEKNVLIQVEPDFDAIIAAQSGKTLLKKAAGKAVRNKLRIKRRKA